MADILSRRALSAGRLAALGATPDFHHGLLDKNQFRHFASAVLEGNSATPADNSEPFTSAFNRWPSGLKFALYSDLCTLRADHPADEVTVTNVTRTPAHDIHQYPLQPQGTGGLRSGFLSPGREPPPHDADPGDTSPDRTQDASRRVRRLQLRARPACRWRVRVSVYCGRMVAAVATTRPASVVHWLRPTISCHAGVRPGLFPALPAD
jgi:hypothetical protein